MLVDERPLPAEPTNRRAVPVRHLMLWWASVVAAVGAGVLYLLTLAPSITVAYGTGDSGEFASTAYTLGIAHPTGYPLYMLLGYVIAHLGAEPAHSLNMFSAVLGALAIGFLACLALQCARVATPRAPLVPALVACALAVVPFALSTSFWTEAVTTESRTLALALAGAVLVLLIVPPQLRAWHALAAAALYGFALCDHLLSLYLAPACVLMLVPWARLQPLRWLSLLGCLLIGLCPYFYLPIRAAQGPVANWGNPDSLSRFWWVVSAQEYRSEMFGLDLPGFLRRVTSLYSQMQNELTGLTIIAAVIGVGVLAWRKPLIAAALAITFVIDLAGTSNDQADAAPAYLLLASYCLCIVAAVGWLALGYVLVGLLRRAVPPALAVTLAALVCFAAVAVAEYPAASTARQAVHDLSTMAFRDYGVRVLRSLPPHAIIFAGTILFPAPYYQLVETSVPFWYAQRALGVRPDVTIVAIGLLNFAWYYRQLRALPSFDQRTLPDSAVSDPLVDLPLVGHRIQLLGRAARPGHPLFMVTLEPDTLLGDLCAQQPRYGPVFACVRVGAGR